MRRILLLSVLPLLGCATRGSGGSDLTSAPQTRTVITGSTSAAASGSAYSSAIRYSNEPVTVEERVDAPQGVVWPLLIEAYRAEGLEPDGADPEAGILNLSRVEWSRTRLGLPLSTFLECGPSSTGRPLADDARVVTSIAAQVVAGESGDSQVTLRIEALAYPFDASTGQPRGCTSLGVLERDIVDRIRVALEPGPVGMGFQGAEDLATPAPASPAGPVAPSDLPLKPGDDVRVWVAPSVQLTGSFMGIRPDTLLLMRSRRTALPIWSIEALQVRRTDKASTVIGALIGVATGITVAMTTGMGIGGSHAVQGDILNPGLGALAGGLLGAWVGHQFISTSWEDVPWEVVRPGR